VTVGRLGIRRVSRHTLLPLRSCEDPALIAGMVPARRRNAFYNRSTICSECRQGGDIMDGVDKSRIGIWNAVQRGTYAGARMVRHE
jgi:hypothetical protein